MPYLGCLVYLVYKKDKKLMELFVWPFLILLATVYNPFLMRPIIEKMGWEDRYMRFYWLLPAEFLCAYLLARLVNRKAKREVQFAVGVVVLGIVFLCGSSLVKYIPDENVYKIDSWVLETSELIAETSKKENPVTCRSGDVQQHKAVRSDRDRGGQQYGDGALHVHRYGRTSGGRAV